MVLHFKLLGRRFFLEISHSFIRTYGLNPDLVFQKRWASLEVTPETIQEFLDRIQDREWIRFECERRIPSQKNANKILLEYGLKESDSSQREEDLRYEYLVVESLMFVVISPMILYIFVCIGCSFLRI